MLLKCLYPPSSKLLLPLLVKMSHLGEIPLRVLGKLRNGLLVFCPFVLFLQAETGLDDIAHQMHFEFIIFLQFDLLWETRSGLLLTD